MNQKTADNTHTILHASRHVSGFTLAQMAVILVILGLFFGSMYMGEDIVWQYRIHSQVAQIADFDEAVTDFHSKYEGLPGDLIAIMAERQGLPAGAGTPAHGDGDGNISPCNLGWQWHLGCETALFWSHLALSGMIGGNFTADSRFVDTRLLHVNSMDPYLPKSPLTQEGVYLAVWSTVPSQPSPKPQLPYGNYYEISRIRGVEDEKFLDDSKAVTPAQALALDTKIDDGQPLSGRVSVNGEADWPKDAWGSYAKPSESGCVAPDRNYNTGYILRAQTPLCHLAIMFGCCSKGEASTPTP